MDNAGKIDNAGQMDEFEPAALHSSRAKGSRKRVGGVQMHSEAVGNRMQEACCMPGSARPPSTVGTRKRRVAWARERGSGVLDSILSGMAPGREYIVGGRARRRQGGRHIPWVRMGAPRVKGWGPELGGGVAAA